MGEGKLGSVMVHLLRPTTLPVGSHVDLWWELGHMLCLSIWHRRRGQRSICATRRRPTAKHALSGMPRCPYPFGRPASCGTLARMSYLGFRSIPHGGAYQLCSQTSRINWRRRHDAKQLSRKDLSSSESHRILRFTLCKSV